MFRLILGIVLWLASPCWAAAAMYTINVSAGDCSVRNPGTPVTNSTDGLLPGKTNSPLALWSAVMPFELPAFAFNEVIVDAHLQFTARSDGLFLGGTPSADLYGLDYRNTNTLLATDFFEGSDDPNAAKLQDRILTPGLPTTNTVVDTDPAPTPSWPRI